MRWKEIIVGAIVTLLVTIFAGLFVSDYTKIPTEKINFQIQPPFVFETKNTKISIITIQVGNFGNTKASNVKISIQFENPLFILDKKISLSSQPIEEYVDQSKSKSEALILVPALMKDDTATITLMVQGVVKNPPVVNVRSDSSVGELGIFTQTETTWTIKKILKLLIILGFLYLFLFYLFSKRYTKIIRVGYKQSLNNTGFLYLHQGLIDQARKFFQKELETLGGEPFLLSNYALTMGIEGDVNTAKKILNAANWMANSDAEKAIVAFNSAILNMKNGDVEKAKVYFSNCIKLNGKEIKKYLEMSQLTKKYFKKYPLIENEVNLMLVPNKK
jgi:tetratricopeptide (TPR) repeat protein